MGEKGASHASMKSFGERLAAYEVWDHERPENCTTTEAEWQCRLSGHDRAATYCQRKSPDGI